MTKLPEIRVRYLAPRNHWRGYAYWQTEPCPFCGRKHTHGAGKPGEPLLLMSRVPHCHGGNGDYELVADMRDKTTREAVERYGLRAPRGTVRRRGVVRAL